MKKPSDIFLKDEPSFDMEAKEKDIVNVDKLVEGEDFEIEIQNIRNIIQMVENDTANRENLEKKFNHDTQLNRKRNQVEF